MDNNYSLYLGPKYVDAMHAIHDGINNTTDSQANIIKIPCEQYISEKPEKDKKKKIKSEKHIELVTKKLKFCIRNIHLVENMLMIYRERVKIFVVREFGQTASDTLAKSADVNLEDFPGVGNLFTRYRTNVCAYVRNSVPEIRCLDINEPH